MRFCLQSLGFSERNIAQSCGVSRNTVAKVFKKAAEINISWPLDFDMTDSALEELMFPKDKSATNKRMPDFNYIRKELLRNGVNKKLLWVEYCEECRMSNEEPLMYSQFSAELLYLHLLQHSFWKSTEIEYSGLGVRAVRWLGNRLVII